MFLCPTGHFPLSNSAIPHQRRIPHRLRTTALEAKNKNVRGQGHNMQVFSKRKAKRSSRQKPHFSHKILGVCQKKKNGYDHDTFLTDQKKVQSSTENRAFLRNCRLRGQGLELRSQGQGFQNVFSRPRTLSRTPSLILLPA